MPSSSLNLRQIPSKMYHSVAGNVAYKAIPSLLLPHPPRGSYASLPPTLSRPSCRVKGCVLSVKISFSWSPSDIDTVNRKCTFRHFGIAACRPSRSRKKVLLYLVLIFCTRPNLAPYTFCTGNLGPFFFLKNAIPPQTNIKNATVQVRFQ